MAGKNKEEHDEAIEEVMRRARKHKVKFNSKKLQYCQQGVKYLGHRVAEGQIKPDPEYIESINDMRQPTNKEDIRRVLGMTNFVSKFILNYSKITAALSTLLHKNVLFEWHEEQQEAFSKLKTYMTVSYTHLTLPTIYSV